MLSSIKKRSIIHYLVALGLFSLYGVQVCPFLDSLTPLELLGPSSIAFLIIFIVRLGMEPRLDTLDFKDQVRQQFRLDFGLFSVAGIALGLFNTFAFQFPLESGGKVVVGMLMLGFFIACDMALFREFRLAQKLKAHGGSISPDDSPYPMTRKFTLFAAVCLLSVVVVVFLVINKDLLWLIHTGDAVPLETARGYILGEVIFIVGTMMAYILTIIFGYSRNLKLFLSVQNDTLTEVTAGNLAASVPVLTNDEFGLMAIRTNQMIRALEQHTNELNITRDASILGLASLAETRDNETGAHILRTQRYVRLLAAYMQKQTEYSDYLSDEMIDLLFKSAPLHDVGKVGIPDAILLKPGKLTDDEFSIMKQHPQIGADALQVAEEQLGSNSFLRVAREISLTHHEKWDGSGYPNGLSGEQIPLSGRLMAVADVYDALISKRVYKPAFSHDKAKSILLEGKGTHFDPTVIDAFLAVENEFVAVASEYQDSEH